MANGDLRFAICDYSPRLSGGQRRLLRLAVAMVGSPAVLILAVVLSFLLLSLPSLVVTIVRGSLLLGLPIVLHPAILIVAPLCAISLAGIGALIGSTARNPQEAGSLSLLVTLVMLGLGPVLVSPARLPGARWLSCGWWGGRWIGGRGRGWRMEDGG